MIPARFASTGAMPPLSADKRDFIEFALDSGVLRFGTFTLKSGRESPYFFNLGAIAGGAALARLGGFYARRLEASGFAPDVLFGPAYKGITLAAATAIAAADAGRDVGFAYNRKEAKDHGEGGRLVGAPLAGRIVIVDDVVTAGTAVREALAIIRANGAEAAGLLVAIDREERGPSGRGAIAELAAEEGLPAAAIITLGNVVEWLSASGRYGAELERVREYRRRYGTSG